MAYITQFYTWATGNTITAARLNGNISNLIDGLSAGTKDINVVKLQIAGSDVIDSSQNITNTGDITTTSSTSLKPVWTIKNTNADTGSGELQFYKLSASPADGDDVGNITFYGDDDGTNKTLYAQILAESTDVTDTTEDGKLTIYTMTAGTSTASLTIESSNITIGGTLTDGTFTVSSGAFTGVTSLTVDNLVVNGNDISSSSGNITLTPVAGSSVVIDGGASFDGTVLTGLTALTSTDITGTIQTAAQGNITSLGTLTTLTVDDITVNGNAISSSGASALTITATAGQTVSIESVTLDGGVVAGVTTLTTSGAINGQTISSSANFTGSLTTAGVVSVDDTTQSTSTTTGSIHTDGGLGVVKDVYVGGVTNRAKSIHTASGNGETITTVNSSNIIWMNGSGAHRTGMVLSDGSYDGQELELVGYTWGIQLDTSAFNCTPIVADPDYSNSAGDVLWSKFVWNGSVWYEVSRETRA